MTDQPGTQNGLQQSPSNEKAVPQTRTKEGSIPAQESFAFPSDQILSKTETEDIIMIAEADPQKGVQRTPFDDSSDLEEISKEEFHANQNHIPKPRQVNKRMSKRIREQKFKTLELTTQANPTKDNLIDAHAELQVSRKDLQDHETKLQEAAVHSRPSQRKRGRRKRQFSHMQDDVSEVQQVNQGLASVRRELEARQDNLRRTQNTYKELQEARRKLAASQDDLTACKDELFRLQPIAQTPDSRVATELENLCQQIINWIEAEVATFEKAHPAIVPEYIFSIGEDKEAAQFMNQLPRHGEHLVAYMIHRWLQDHLFEQKLSCLGLPSEAIQLLERAEQSMARLDPPRDSTTIAAWRSETLKALASTEECEKTRIRETQDMNGSLFKDLSKTLPLLFTGRERYSSFYVQILRPAVNLARMIHESTTRYKWSFQKSTSKNWTPFGKAALGKYKMVDMKTGKCLKPDSLVAADEEGVVGYAVLMIEPGLRRTNGEGMGNILKQQTFMAHLKFPLGKRNGPSA